MIRAGIPLRSTRRHNGAHCCCRSGHRRTVVSSGRKKWKDVSPFPLLTSPGEDAGQETRGGREHKGSPSMYEMEGLPWLHRCRVGRLLDLRGFAEPITSLADQPRTSGHSVFALPKVDSGPSCRHWRRAKMSSPPGALAQEVSRHIFKIV
jgi:hypothetical protein